MSEIIYKAQNIKKTYVEGKVKTQVLKGVGSSGCPKGLTSRSGEGPGPQEGQALACWVHRWPRRLQHPRLLFDVGGTSAPLGLLSCCPCPVVPAHYRLLCHVSPLQIHA